MEVNIYYADDLKWSKRKLIHWSCLHCSQQSAL